MRAAVSRTFGAPLVIEDVSIAVPGPTDVLVDIAACAICHSDVSYMDGAWGGHLPMIFGHEASGIVSDVGADVTDLARGDSVVVTLVRSCRTCFFCRAGDQPMCETTFRLDREPPLHSADGQEIRQGLRTAAFAEQVLVHRSQVVVVPSEMPKDVAALLGCGVVTGFGAVNNTARVPPGASVVVVGVGGVGLNCIQGAVHAGAQVVVAIDLLDHKLDTARLVGATAAVNANKQDVATVVADVTEGRGADYVFVAAGTASAVEHAMPLMRRAGRLVIVGMPPTGDLASIDTTDLADKGQQILGSKMGAVDIARDIPLLSDLYETGRLKLDELITDRYRLDEINDAVDSARAGEAVRNVIVFD